MATVVKAQWQLIAEQAVADKVVWAAQDWLRLRIFNRNKDGKLCKL
jgi:hypothetical protein